MPHLLRLLECERQFIDTIVVEGAERGVGNVAEAAASDGIDGVIDVCLEVHLSLSEALLSDVEDKKEVAVLDDEHDKVVNATHGLNSEHGPIDLSANIVVGGNQIVGVD